MITILDLINAGGPGSGPRPGGGKGDGEEKNTVKVGRARVKELQSLIQQAGWSRYVATGNTEKSGRGTLGFKNAQDDRLFIENHKSGIMWYAMSGDAKYQLGGASAARGYQKVVSTLKDFLSKAK
jgi:hypothetical protein